MKTSPTAQLQDVTDAYKNNILSTLMTSFILVAYHFIALEQISPAYSLKHNNQKYPWIIRYNVYRCVEDVS